MELVLLGPVERALAKAGSEAAAAASGKLFRPWDAQQGCTASTTTAALAAVTATETSARRAAATWCSPPVCAAFLAPPCRDWTDAAELPWLEAALEAALVHELAAAEEYARLLQTSGGSSTQHRKLRPKKYRCPHCQVGFSNNGQLKGHIRIHTAGSVQGFGNMKQSTPSSDGEYEIQVNLASNVYPQPGASGGGASACGYCIFATHRPEVGGGRREAVQVRRGAVRQDVHAQRGADPPQEDPLRPAALPVRLLRQEVRPQGPPEEAREDAPAAAAAHATARTAAPAALPLPLHLRVLTLLGRAAKKK